jgi:hypothetical protein
MELKNNFLFDKLISFIKKRNKLNIIDIQLIKIFYYKYLLVMIKFIVNNKKKQLIILGKKTNKYLINTIINTEW